MVLEVRGIVVGVVMDIMVDIMLEVMWHLMMDIVVDVVVHILMISFPDLLWVWDCSCGNWNINVLCPVGNWLIVGMVSDISHWLPIYMHLLMVYRLKFCLSSIIFVLW